MVFNIKPWLESPSKPGPQVPFIFYLFIFFFAKLCQDPLFLFVKTGHNTKLLAYPADTQATNACSAVEAFSSMFEK